MGQGGQAPAQGANVRADGVAQRFMRMMQAFVARMLLNTTTTVYITYSGLRTGCSQPMNTEHHYILVPWP